MAKSKAKGWDDFKAATESMLAICEHVASGESLASFCRERGFAYVTVLDWINADGGRSENYAHAKDARTDIVFESLDEVSEQAVTAETAIEVAGLRLKADNIKWKLARMAPKKYGDRTTVAGDPEAPLESRTVFELSDAALLAIAAKGRAS